MMTLERFAALVDAHGADPRRWPEAERPDALRLIAARPDEAEAILAPARALDAALETVRAPVPDIDAFTARLMPRIAPRIPEWASLAAAASLAVGLGLGWMGAGLQTEDPAARAYEIAFASLEVDEADWLDGAM